MKDVARNYDAIHQGRDRSIFLVKRANTPNRTWVVQLGPGADGFFYDVKTALVSRPDFMKGKLLLWERAQSDQSVAVPLAQSRAKALPGVIPPSQKIKMIELLPIRRSATR